MSCSSVRAQPLRSLELKRQQLPRRTNGLQRVVVFVFGAILPLITLRVAGDGVDHWLERVTVSDVLAVVICCLMVLGKQLQLSRSLNCYIACVTLSLAIGVCNAWGSDEYVDVVVEYAALVIAASFFLVGYNIACNSGLHEVLLWGVIAGVFWEGVIVAHDYMYSGAQWFPDTNERRVRGTFRACGQLGAYAFAAAAICFTGSAIQFCRKWLSRWLLSAGGLSLFIIVAASRRSAIFSVLGAVALHFVLAFRFGISRSQVVLLMGIVGIAAGFYLNRNTLQDSFLASRMTHKIEELGTGESWTELEFESAMHHVFEWFPLGLGMGRGKNVSHDGWHELHNGNLSLIVELGLPGFLVFYAILGFPLWRSARALVSGRAQVYNLVLFCTLIGAVAFMIHNRLHRDRTFMLFLGLATAQVTTCSAARASASKSVLQTTT